MNRLKHWSYHLLMRFAMSPLFPDTKLRPQMLRAIGVKLPKSSSVGSGTIIGGPWHVFGERVFINTDCFLDGATAIVFGDDVRIGARTVIVTGTHDIEPSVIRRNSGQPTKCLPVSIGRGCWIGAGCTVLPGVSIAEGCVVGAGSVVHRSTEPNGLYAGNPARRLKDLPVDEKRVVEAPRLPVDAFDPSAARRLGRPSASRMTGANRDAAAGA